MKLHAIWPPGPNNGRVTIVARSMLVHMFIQTTTVKAPSMQIPFATCAIIQYKVVSIWVQLPTPCSSFPVGRKPVVDDVAEGSEESRMRGCHAAEGGGLLTGCELPTT